MMEERYPVIEGAEAFYYKGNEIGLLISHGFVGTPQSVRYIGEKLAEKGYSVLAPRLPGHGTHYQDLESFTYQDWFTELERGYQFLAQQCSVVFVIGQSMGGTLTLRLAHKYPEIKGIVTINAALSLPAFDHLRNESSPRFIAEGEPDIKARGVYEITYPKTPLHAIHQLQALMESTLAIVSEINTPILCVKSAVDHVVPPENTDFIYKNSRANTKELITLPNSYHVATMDHDKKHIVEQLHLFVEKQCSEQFVPSF
jgi:carboxylesterase